MSILEGLKRIASEHPETRMALLPLIKEASSCGDKYKNDEGTFKGKPGEKFDNCKKFMTDCRDDVDDPDALCAWIGREHGKIAAGTDPKRYLQIDLNPTGLTVYFNLLYLEGEGLTNLYEDVQKNINLALSHFKGFFAEVGDGGVIKHSPNLKDAVISHEVNKLRVSGIVGTVKFPLGWLEELGIHDENDYREKILPLVGGTWNIREIFIGK
jgi:hypothetical protein